MKFDLDSAQRRQLGYQLVDCIDEYFAGLSDRPVQPALEERTFDEKDGELPECGTDASRVLRDLCTELIDRGFHIPSANYLGLMNPTPVYVAILAEMLV